MKSIADANLKSAAQIYAISNTPTFLIRRLQEDPVIFEMAKSFSGEQISEELHRATEHNPYTLLDYVRPYAYLAALSKLPSLEYLRQADVSRLSEKWRWLPYAKDMLVSTYSPMSSSSVEGKKASISTSSPYRVSSSTSAMSIVLGEK